MAGARGVMTTKTSFLGAKVVARAPACARRAHAGSYRRHATQAKYGDDGKYFDLNDIENTSGAWDMYGLEEGVKYPVSQEEFFKRASFGLARREALLGFITLGGGGAILTWGALGSKQAGLPITKGPAPPPPPPAEEEGASK